MDENGAVADYQSGDRVHVANFGKGIVRQVRNHGRYLVEVKGRAMEVDASQLSVLDGPGKRRASPSSGQGASDRPTATVATDPDAHAVVTVDLHGHTVDEALEALEKCLNDALLAGAAEVRVIHGKSGGRVKAAVQRRLQELSVVRHVRLDPHNPGVTIVTL